MLALSGAMLLILPLDLVAVVRLTGWEWWTALGALLALNLVPFAGQAIYACLAIAGAFMLGQDNLASLKASNEPQPVSAAPTTTSVDKFAEWKRAVGGPKVQEECISKAQSQGLVEGRQIEQMARVCACYGAAAVNILEPSDVVDETIQASPQLNAKLSDEARRLCKG